MDLSSLARAAASGDRHAADRLVEETFTDVWRFARHLVGAKRAEDAVQSAYLRAWHALSKNDPIGDVKPWLLTITWRACADQLRSDYRHQRRLERLRIHTQTDAQAEADTTSVEQLLAGLDPERRSAFVLTQLLGYSYAEAAAISDTEIGTIRSRVWRARTQLVEALSVDDDDRQTGNH